MVWLKTDKPLHSIQKRFKCSTTWQIFIQFTNANEWDATLQGEVAAEVHFVAFPPEVVQKNLRNNFSTLYVIFTTPGCSTENGKIWRSDARFITRLCVLCVRAMERGGWCIIHSFYTQLSKISYSKGFLQVNWTKFVSKIKFIIHTYVCIDVWIWLGLLRVSVFHDTPKISFNS